MYKLVFFIVFFISGCSQYKEVPVYWKGENSYKNSEAVTKSTNEFEQSDDEILDLIDENIYF